MKKLVKMSKMVSYPVDDYLLPPTSQIALTQAFSPAQTCIAHLPVLSYKLHKIHPQYLVQIYRTE